MIGYFSLSVPSGLSIYWLVTFSSFIETIIFFLLLSAGTSKLINNRLIVKLDIMGINLSVCPKPVSLLVSKVHLAIFRFTNNVLSTAQQVWLRKLGGAKPVVDESASGIITAGRAKRSVAQPAPPGDRSVRCFLKVVRVSISASN